MLCYIENDKSKLKDEVAFKIANRFNLLIGNSNIVITQDYLMESIESQLKKLILEAIFDLKNIDIKKISEFRELFFKYGFKHENISLFFIIANYIKYKDIKNSEILFNEILEMSIVNKIENFIFNIILELQRIYSRQGDYQKTILLYNKVVNLLKDKNVKKIKGYILYNFGLAFEVQNQFNQAIILFKDSIPLLDKTKILFKAYNNLSICYSKINEYDNSNRIILELLKTGLSNDERAKCYTNFIMNAIYLKDNLCFKVTIPKLESLLNSFKDIGYKKYQSYYCLGRAYLMLEDRYNAMINFEKELQLGIGENGDNFFIDQYEFCIEQLVNIYNDSDINKFRKLESYIFVIPNEMFNKDFFIKIVIKFLKVYSKKESIQFYKKMNKKLYF